MTNTDVTLSFVLGIDPGPTTGTASLRVAQTQRSDGSTEQILLSYGVPIALRDEAGNVFVDCFSQWSRTTSKHQSHAWDTAKAHATSAHRVTFSDLRAERFTARKPPRERRKPIGSTL
jgi:predicted NAD-dependent protein-ADP-ribosyltransferase YbiA (DUF1768 family)